MNQYSLPALFSMTLLGVLVTVTCTGAQDLPAATGPAEQPLVSKNNTDRPPVTRSDGSTAHISPPDPNEVRKLVQYMRDGMNRADRADKDKVTKRVIQNRRIWIRK
jgi:hypothetical protein